MRSFLGDILDIIWGSVSTNRKWPTVAAFETHRLEFPTETAGFWVLSHFGFGPLPSDGRTVRV